MRPARLDLAMSSAMRAPVAETPNASPAPTPAGPSPRRRFGLAVSASLPSRRLVVMRSGPQRAGLVVDGVSEVLRTSEGAIQPPPELTGDATRYVEGIVSIGESGRLVLLLSPFVKRWMHLDTLEDRDPSSELAGQSQAGIEAQEAGVHPATRA